MLRIHRGGGAGGRECDEVPPPSWPASCQQQTLGSHVALHRVPPLSDRPRTRTKGASVLGEMATKILEGRCPRGGRAQSSRTMGSLVLAGWAGGTGTKGATTGRSTDFTLSGRLGRRAARRISRWLRAFRSALQGEREKSGERQGPTAPEDP